MGKKWGARAPHALWSRHHWWPFIWVKHLL